MNKNNNVVNTTSLWWKSLGKCLANKLSYIASSYRHSLISHRVAKSTICWHANTFPNTFTLFALKVTLRYCFTILDCNTLPIANTHTYTQRHTHTHTHTHTHRDTHTHRHTHTEMHTHSVDVHMNECAWSRYKQRFPALDHHQHLSYTWSHDHWNVQISIFVIPEQKQLGVSVKLCVEDRVVSAAETKNWRTEPEGGVSAQVPAGCFFVLPVNVSTCVRLLNDYCDSLTCYSPLMTWALVRNNVPSKFVPATTTQRSLTIASTRLLVLARCSQKKFSLWKGGPKLQVHGVNHRCTLCSGHRMR